MAEGEKRQHSDISINLNQPARVRLTVLGIQHYREWHGRLGIEREPELDAEGWLHEQLWSIIAVFGEKLGNGFKVPFETTIIIEPFPEDRE